MILLKANDELKNVFGRMIKAMGENVTWTGNFVVLNNFLILSGNVRSLIFSFDNRKVITNVIELPDKEEDMEPVENNETLANVLNMTLYAFGKWGTIKGLKVDQDYRQLNGLFYAILKDIKVTPGFRDDNFRFYQDNIQMTYEEVVQLAMEEGKRKADEWKKEENKEEDSKKDDTEEKGLGLWHKIRWVMEKAAFAKEGIEEYERKASRLGNNFYITGYRCPGCGRKLYMAVYPQGREFPVETEEGRVYLARSYTCNNCNLFYTPRPGKLLREGDSYTMKFGGDRNAYEDYQELLGSKAERTSNCNFNEFESQRGRHAVPSVEEACANLEDRSEEELRDLEEKIEDSFFPPMKAEPYREKIEELLQTKQREKNVGKQKAKETESSQKTEAKETESSKKTEVKTAPKTEKKETGEQEKEIQSKDSQAEDSFSQGIESETKEKEQSIQEKTGRKERGRFGGSGKRTGRQKPERENASEEVFGREKYDAHMKVLERMSSEQLKGLREQIQSDEHLEWVEKEKYTRQIKQAVSRKEEEEARQKAEKCKDKPYGVLKRVMEEISQSECPESVKKELFDSLQKLKQQRGKEEVEQLIAKVPENMNRSQYRTLREKFDQYQDIDISAYQEVLEGKRRLAEKREIAAMLKRAEKADRNGLVRMMNQLKEEGFSESQAAPALEKIESKIKALDEKAIDKICPNIMGMTFDEAAEAYEKIEGGAFLPELKTNTLEMIDKRLTKLKMDECELLVEKLKDALNGKIKDTDRIHFYEARKIMRGDWEPREAELVARALNTYAGDRERYEFPILICDSSNRKNGKEGFILTPDHIFYNSTFNSEKIPVRSIVGMEGNTGLLNRGICVNRGKGTKTKIPGGIPAKELKVFAGILNGFVSYLQEKPESRSIAYLAKEKHEVKCCYRCGFTYRGGNICPKCGNQENH